MSSRKNNWSLGIGAFILLASLVWIFTQIQAQNNPPLKQEASPAQLPVAEKKDQPAKMKVTKNESPVGIFYYAQIENGNTSLFSYNPASGEKKLYYYDKDESSKILQALGLDKHGDILIFEETSGGAGKLVKIKTGGKVIKKTLASDIFSVNPPALSPDQEKIAITSFSNAESDFGFSLFTQNLDGSNKRKIAQAKTNILSPVFSPDSAQIAFVINQGKQGSKVEVYNFNKSSLQTILQTPQIITSLAWLNNNLIASISPTGTATANHSEIYEIKLADGTTKQLTDNQLNENNLFSYNQGRNLAYISQELPSGITGQNTPGAIKIYDREIDFKNIKASYLFGWKK